MAVKLYPAEPIRNVLIDKRIFMKTNFKKLALMAGISAAMAGGSMSAHAIIQAVPAPAVLIPFVANDSPAGTNGTFTTNFRIEVPSSVGLDSVVNLFDGPDTTPAGAIPSSGVATGLATSVSSAASSATSKLHWYFMDRRSNEVLNSAFPVSANDVIEFNSNAMPTNSGTISLGTDNAIGYLVIVNESASLGGAPLFAFQADAFLTNTFQPPGAPPVSLVNNIPVYPLTDTADNQAASPTLVNNVLEDVSGVPAGAPYGGGPIVSPLMSGIRLAAANAGGATQGWFRVIDFPINGANAAATARGEYYVVWSDRNDSLNLVNGALVDTPAITGSVVTYDCNENQISGAPLSFEDQLNVLHISNTANPNPNPAPGFNDVEVSLGNTGACVNASPATGPSGFLRWFAQPNPYNVGGLTNAAYQAGVIFRLRQGALDGYSQFPVDRGFFTAK
jgi:hypothetical protein